MYPGEYLIRLVRLGLDVRLDVVPKPGGHEVRNRHLGGLDEVPLVGLVQQLVQAFLGRLLAVDGLIVVPVLAGCLVLANIDG